MWSHHSAIARTLGAKGVQELARQPSTFNPFAVAPSKPAPAGRKRRVLYLGPSGFRPGVWSTRADYIFPDLLDSISGSKVMFLIGQIPDYARAGMDDLIRRYDLKVKELPARDSKMSVRDHWQAEAIRAALEFKPHVVTNIFGGVFMSQAVGMAAAAIGARSVVRIAGDEIASRVAAEDYEAGSDLHVIDAYQEYAGFNMAHNILVMSEWERQRVARRLVSGRDRVLVCPRGIDLNVFQPRDGFGDPTERKVFSYVGRKSPEKGYDLIEQAAQILYRQGSPIRVRFAGTFEPEEVDNRHYVGFVKSADLPEFYQSSDAFVLCSRTEGFPQVVMEAMACGLPCILSRHLFESVFIDGEDALLIDINPKSIAQAMKKLNRQPRLAAKLSKRSLQIARDMFVKTARMAAYRQAILGAG
jgi:glycosyltransferase involved in cell wall biosynthesis